MTLELRCVADGCDEILEGKTENDVLLRAERHLAEAHPSVPADEDTMRTVRRNIARE